MRPVVLTEKEQFMIETMARMEGPVHIHYDLDYGELSREGWSVVVNGIVVTQFLDTMQESVTEAFNRQLYRWKDSLEIAKEHGDA